MAQTPQENGGKPQHSAMFEALATTKFEYDEICSLLPNKQLSSSSSGRAESGSVEFSGADATTTGSYEVPYSERKIEGVDDEAPVQVVKPWWKIGLKWAGWRRPQVYQAVHQ
ncbi:hypothetical protein PG999_001573 [Apiospora kogelbergensis]|uniref:Uncharacterized protein n=1 Tax=Apiospora kogelbergensis TaxID=1337665 RepID=A0AAW0R5Y7_9PEZI